MLDLLGGKGAARFPVEFLKLREDQTADGEIDPHADGVRGHQNGVFPPNKSVVLPPAHFRWEVPINHAGANAQLREIPRQGQHRAFGKGHQRIAPPHTAQPHRSIFHLQRHQAGIGLKFVFVAAVMDHGDQMLFCKQSAAQMDFRAGKTQNGSGPRVAPLGVGKQLYLIDHRHVVLSAQICLFHRTAQVLRTRHGNFFLPGEQTAGNALRIQPFIVFQRQNPQGRQINA
ncbi:hypothetical protein SDC9_157498 [bioreactor metagenome]|uniref:Uncharacterized protein n=1 Tax=bioreactor metagenome TaxID=1076179 RepID=A0A645FCV8_9ZZZZ